MSIKKVIVIIDSEPEIGKLLSITLEAEGYKVILSTIGKDGILSVAKYNPQLVMVDLCLPDQDGFSVLKEIRSWSTVPILILSAKRDIEETVKALDLGADDFIVKPFNTSELVARMKAIMRRTQLPETETIVKNGNLKIDFSKRIVYKNDDELKLTNTEYLLMFLFFKNIDKVLTHNYVLKEIWGPGYTEDSQYLRVFIGQIRKKIEDNPTKPNYIITESGVGYRMKLVK